MQQAELVALSLTAVLITEKLPGKASLQQEKNGYTERFADFFFSHVTIRGLRAPTQPRLTYTVVSTHPA